MIKLENISFSYKEKPIINNFSLTINKNDRICIFGESGCGKTTILRLILGLEKPQSGNLVGLSDLKASAVFQENRLLPFKTVLENITLIGATTEKAIENLKALGIANTAHKYPDMLSGGMLRRVAIARALSADFDFLVLDEMFTGLDQNNIEIAAQHILNVAGARPIIMVSHSMSEIELFNAKTVKM